MSKENIIEDALINPLKSISKIWLVPMVAIFIGVWIIGSHINSKGTLISIHFLSGKGIEAGKTKIRIKSVDVGIVESLELSENLKGVSVTARIHKKNEYLLKDDTQFWVVRPRIGKSGVSGIGTLFSGAYIELAVGVGQEDKFDFVGLENVPVTLTGTAGRHVTLESSGFKSLQVGDPILFHGITVGRIEDVDFNADKRTVYYDAFIETPYDRLITTNTKFWEMNGVEINLSAEGVRFQSGTVESMLTGGVTFDVPKDMPRGEVIAQRMMFTIYPNKEAIYESRYKQSLKFILLFKDSIRGLTPNAPVEYKGIKIGSVIRTDVNYKEIGNILDPSAYIPVLIAIEPARLGFKFSDEKEVLPIVKKEMTHFLQNGLRGGLASGNLLTGSKYIELKYDDKMISKLDYFSGHLVIPTLESQIDHILAQVSKVMDKLYKLPVEPILRDADVAVKQMTQTIKEFQRTVEPLEAILKQATDQNLVGSIKATLDNFKQLAASFSEGSLTHTELKDLIGTMKGVLSKLDPLLIQLNQKPSSFVFSQQKKQDIEPKADK